MADRARPDLTETRESEADMDPEELVVAYQASHPMEAQFIVDQLKSEGIKAVCDSLDMQNMLGPWDGNPRVYVHARDLERSRVWLEDYDAKQKSRED